MNYRHIYHAGNFADVCKHSLLLSLITSLKRKEAAFCYLDTHAGRGRYLLLTNEAQKTKEYQEGISRLLEEKNLPPELQTYREIVLSFNQANFACYPGSPCLVQALLRNQDRSILTELHPEEFTLLKHEFHKGKQVAVHHLDGYQAVKAFLPPQENRGLLFVDPPFEKNQEFNDILESIQLANKRWHQGIIAIWYPIKERYEIVQFHRKLKNTGIKKILVTELCLFPDDTRLRLNGSGMIVINPPWQFEKTAQTILTTLAKLLAIEEAKAKTAIYWLTTE